MKTILRVIILSFLLTTISIADIINVPADIDSIQGGINMANEGDTVLVDVGTYYENINFNGKNIVVGSLTLTTGDTSYISQTVIDGNQNGSVVKFENGEDSTAQLYGFTLTNGFFVFGGGGLHIIDSSPSLFNMLIKHNEAGGGWFPSGRGGGIYLKNSNSKISQVILSSNTAHIGGGIFCDSSNIILSDLIIKNNMSALGGGIYCEGSNFVLENGVVSYNSCSSGDGSVGGGIHFYKAHATLVNVIVSRNLTHVGGGGIWCDDSDLSLSNVTIKENTSVRIGMGGGIGFWVNSYPSFDPVDRCNILNNYSGMIGNDLFSLSDTTISIVVDTFTVLNPDSFHAYPMNKFTFDILHDTSGLTDIREEATNQPTNFSLKQNYPNPFNPSTTIEFTLPKSEHTTLKIFNILGKEMATLVSSKLNQGNHTYTFDGKNLASGIYYYQLVAGDYQQVKKMILIK